MEEKKCQRCGVEFRVNPKYSAAQRSRARFCKKSCESPDQYLRRRTKRNDVNGCLEWQPKANTKGYGQAVVGGKRDKAHRLAYRTWIGPIPDGMDVLHRCDNPPCCEPGHLFLGDQAANNADRHAKGRTRVGRGRHGERNPLAKLTNEQAEEIRIDTRPQRQIAASDGVWQGVVSRIKRGVSYRKA